MWKSEITDSNVIKDGKKEMGILSYTVSAIHDVRWGYIKVDLDKLKYIFQIQSILWYF